ncbi:MAG TPA: sugar ABC transporter substrate-binding protein [Ktedonobacteraceae bacterium]|jgi:D-xylose transport system substrate-binding protein
MHSVLIHRTRKVQLFTALLGLFTIILVLAGCGNNGGPSTTGNGGKGCTKVGVLLPETSTSPRWETYDHPLLVSAIKQALPNVSIDYANAGGSTSEQQSQAEADLTRGDCILVVGAHDSSAAASIVTAAKRQNVPVIAYDRLIQSNDLNYYVSFDGVKVGELQGQYIVDHYQSYVSAGHDNIAFIKGAATDNNALLFSQGAHNALDPIITSGKLVNVYEQYTPDWAPATGQQEMEAALTKTSNNIQAVLASNDDLAGAVVQALDPQHLAGKAIVTGQDATVPGLQRILKGTQSMTVYKPIVKEAQATASLVAAISNGTSVSSLINGSTKTQGGASIPSVLEVPISVDKSNIASTVIADKYVTKQQICAGIPAGTDGVC